MKTRNTKLAITITISVAIIMFVLIAIAIVSKRHAHKITAQATNNTNVYSGVNGNVANNLQHQVTSIKDEINPLADKVDELMALMKKSQNSSNDQQKSRINQKILEKEESLEAEVNSVKQAANKKIELLQQKIAKSNQNTKVGKGDNKPNVHNIHWISDESLIKSDSDNSSSLGDLNTKLNFNKGSTDQQKDKPKPAFTIPDATILTGVTSFNDLVGRIPKGDEHTIFAPYQTVFHIAKDNFTSKNYRLPKAIDNVMGRAICFGDFMSRSVSCKVVSLVYIFADGTIATAYPNQAKKGTDSYSMNFDGLGYFTNQYGSPQIDGKLVTSLGLRIGGVALAGAVSGLGAAVSQSGLSIATTNGFSPINAVTNVGKFGAGQAITDAANASNREFQEVTKNLFDYVDAPHWDKKTKALIKYNIVTTQQIDVDYDPKGRKLNHHLFVSSNQSNTNIF